MAKRIWVKQLDGLGNRALQYLAAEGIRSHVPGSVIENVKLPEWGLVTSETPLPPPVRSVSLGSLRFWIDVQGLADCLNRDVIDSVIMDSYAQHIDNFPPRAVAKKLLVPYTAVPEAQGFGPDVLLCNLRGREILNNVHPDYLVLPPQFYMLLEEHTGLKIVFFGQIDDNPYVASLRHAMPRAEFIPGKNATYDFEVIRKSVNIVPCVSTFSWLAAWLSDAERIILPVAGFMQPAQKCTFAQPTSAGSFLGFLPFGESTYEYVLFPAAHAVDIWKNPAGFFLMQDRLAKNMKFVSENELKSISALAARFHVLPPLLSGFDPEYYLSRNEDVAESVRNGEYSALQHYLDHGFSAGKRPFDLDELFYFSTYPEVPEAIGEGHLLDAWHHYALAGHAKKYLRKP